MTELWLRRQRLAAFVLIYVSAVLSGTWIGLRDGTTLDARSVVRTDLFMAVLMSVSFMWFCTVDAGVLGRPLIPLAKTGIFLGWPVGVPIYLLWARGVRGFAQLLLYGVSLIFVAAVSIIVGALAHASPFSS
jgi:hypothetical protein